MRFSSFFGPSAKTLRGLGDLACERNLLQQLAAQFFYSLTATEAETRAALEAFLYAYLGSTIYASNPVFPNAAALFVIVQGFMVEFLGDSPDVDTLFAIETPTLENLTTWSGRVEIPYVQPRNRVQAEAAMLLCQTPAVDPAAANAAAERARRDAETARAAANVAATTAATATGTPTSAAARAEAAVAAVAASVAAQFAAAATAAATAVAGAVSPSTPTPTTPTNTSTILPGSPSWLILTPAQRAALLAAQYGSGGGGGTDTTTSYLPYIAGGGLLLLAAAVFASKSSKTSGRVTA